jgi:hypothetical protein
MVFVCWTKLEVFWEFIIKNKGVGKNLKRGRGYSISTDQAMHDSMILRQERIVYICEIVSYSK